MSIIYDFKSINQSANQISRHLLWPDDQSFAKPIGDSTTSLVRCGLALVHYRETAIENTPDDYFEHDAVPPQLGQLCYVTNLGRLFMYDGTKWIAVDGQQA